MRMFRGLQRAVIINSKASRVKKYAQSRLAVGVLLLVALTTACGGGGGGGGVTNNPVPGLTSLSPSSVTAGSGAFTLTVNGSNFISSSSVRWNGTARTTTFVSATRLTAAVTASDISAAGTAAVTVSNPSPGGGISNSLNISIVAPSPVAINTASLPPSANGKDYYFLLSSSGGAGAISWTIISGSPPTGLVLDSSTGLISGNIASGAATSTFTVQAADSIVPPDTDTRSMTITVAGLGRNDQVCISPNVLGSDVATPISNGTLRASISPYGDIDTYTFTLTQPATNLSIDTFAQDLDIGNNLLVRSDFLDTVLELLDSSCNVIALNDDLVLGVHTDSEIQIGSTPFPATPPANSDDVGAPSSLPPGTYYIRIRDYRGDGRPDLIYDLTVSGIQ
ncbi:MAG: Ig domain-containing protein [Deltaproteobacteria bacterium]